MISIYLYLGNIKSALLLFPLIAFAFTIPYMIYNYHKYGSVRSIRILIVYSFILYMLCVYFLVILPLPTKEAAGALHGHKTQLVPFRFVHDLLKESHFVISDPKSYLSLINSAFFHTVLNVAMTVPFGIYMRYYFGCNKKKTILFSFLLSLFFELTQLSGLYFIYPGSYRLFDIDDLLANTLGGLLGYLIMKPIIKILPSRTEIDKVSYQRGQSISLVRRTVAFGIDVLCIGLLSLLFGTLVPYFRSNGTILVFLLYFILIPGLTHGLTLGKMVMRIRIVNKDGANAQLYQYLIKYGVIAFVYGILPYLLKEGLALLTEYGSLEAYGQQTMSLIIVGLYALFILLEAILASIHKPLFHERISKTRLISTIKKSSDV